MKEDIKIKDLKIIRNIDVDNPKLIKIMNERNTIADKINVMNDSMKKTVKERRKLELKMERLKEKTKPLIEREMKNISTNQWEVMNRILFNNGKIKFEIVDYIESYKRTFLEKKKNNGKKH